jgi:hypothetical protein
VTTPRNQSWVRTSDAASMRLAAKPPESTTNGTSQMRYCGEKTLPKATKPATAAAAE